MIRIFRCFLVFVLILLVGLKPKAQSKNDSIYVIKGYAETELVDGVDREFLEKELIKLSTIDAIEKQFGKVVYAENSLDIKNKTENSKSSSNTEFNSLNKTFVKADIKEVLDKKIEEKNVTSYRTVDGVKKLIVTKLLCCNITCKAKESPVNIEFTLQIDKILGQVDSLNEKISLVNQKVNSLKKITITANTDLLASSSNFIQEKNYNDAIEYLTIHRENKNFNELPEIFLNWKLRISLYYNIKEYKTSELYCDSVLMLYNYDSEALSYKLCNLYRLNKIEELKKNIVWLLKNEKFLGNQYYFDPYKSLEKIGLKIPRELITRNDFSLESFQFAFEYFKPFPFGENLRGLYESFDGYFQILNKDIGGYGIEYHSLITLFMDIKDHLSDIESVINFDSLVNKFIDDYYLEIKGRTWFFSDEWYSYGSILKDPYSANRPPPIFTKRTIYRNNYENQDSNSACYIESEILKDPPYYKLLIFTSNEAMLYYLQKGNIDSSTLCFDKIKQFLPSLEFSIKTQFFNKNNSKTTILSIDKYNIELGFLSKSFITSLLINSAYTNIVKQNINDAIELLKSVDYDSYDMHGNQAMYYIKDDISKLIELKVINKIDLLKLQGQINDSFDNMINQLVN